MKYSESDLKRAHKASFEGRKELMLAKKAGCFFCCEIFSPKDVENWVDGGKTAICPHCGIDSVIGDASGYPINQDFLSQMHNYWFEK